MIPYQDTLVHLKISEYCNFHVDGQDENAPCYAHGFDERLTLFLSSWTGPDMSNVETMVVTTEELDSINLDEFLQDHPAIQSMITAIDGGSSGKNLWGSVELDDETIVSPGRDCRCRPSRFDCPADEERSNGTEQTSKVDEIQRRRKRMPRERKREVTTSLSDKDQRLMKLLWVAEKLQLTHSPFTKMKTSEIVRILEKGAKQGLQPQLSKAGDIVPSTSTTFIPPKRQGKKRGPYKLQYKESWTSCQLNASLIQSPNVSHTKRIPNVPFKEKEIIVRDIEFDAQSAGIVEETPFQERIMIAQSHGNVMGPTIQTMGNGVTDSANVSVDSSTWL